MTQKVYLHIALIFFTASTYLLTSKLAEGRGIHMPEATNDLPEIQETYSQLLSRSKRAIYDSSCRGIYSRELFARLDRVCEDCYNLFRKPYVAIECRKNCFAHKTFENCVRALDLDNQKEYLESAKKIQMHQR